MRVVHDLLTAIALSDQYPVGFLGPFEQLRCFRSCCADKIELCGESITMLDSWEEYVALFQKFNNYQGSIAVHSFICVCTRMMRSH